MAKIEWSESQNEAIKTLGKNLLVSASAGSGKTAVLSERIVKLVCEDKVDIDKFVIVTFTRLAAAEMKTRIAKKLNKAKLASNSKEEKDYIDEQIILLEKANIETLDSFNVSLLRDYFYMLDIEPNFKIIDEADEIILSNNVMDKLFNKYYMLMNSEDKNNNDDYNNFISLLKIYSGDRNDDGLKDVIKTLYEYIINSPNPDKTLDNMLSNYTKDITKSLYYTYFKNYINKIINEYIESYEDIKDICDLLSSDYNFMCDIKNNIDDYDYLYKIMDHDFGKLSLKGKGLDEQDEKEVKAIRDEFKKFIRSLKDKYLYGDINTFIGQIDEMLPNLKMLVKLTKEYKEELFNEKKKNNSYGFNDMAHLAIKLLLNEDGSKTDLCKNLSNVISFVIVDEYQDVNDIQETILKAISHDDKDPNMFMVGDVKQSIYGFRNADSDIFTNKYNSFKDDNEVNMKIDLNKNYRSRKEVLDSINFIFSKIMRKDIGGIVYDDNMALKYGDGYIDNSLDNKTELVLLEKIKTIKSNYQKGDDENDDVAELIEETEDAKLQALYIADEIERLLKEYKVQEEVNDEKVLRDLSYKDIAILFRGIKNNAKELYDELKRRGIPVVITKQDNFMDELDVKEAIYVLKALDNPYDNIAFVNILYSDLFKFDANELMKLKRRNKYQRSFYQMIEKEYKNLFDINNETNEVNETNNEDELENEEDSNKDNDIDDKNDNTLDTNLKNKIKNVHEVYDHLKKYSMYNSLEKLIKEIYDTFNKEKYFLRFSNMKQKIDNMNLFLSYAKKYEKSGLKNIYDFIKTIDDIERTKKKIDMKMPLESSDAVSIMTIHKSKGLEYPVVFIPNIEKKFNTDDIKGKILIEKELGYAAKYVNTEKAYTNTNLFYETAKEKLMEEMIAEEMRIYYVAMTRAKEKLYLVSSVDESRIDKAKTKLDNGLVKFGSIMKAQGPIDLILPCIYGRGIENSSCYFNITNKTIDITTYDFTKKEEDTLKDLFDEIKNKPSDMNYDYKYESSTKLKQKVSVTEVKKRKIEELEEENLLAMDSLSLDKVLDEDMNDEKDDKVEKEIEKETSKSYKPYKPKSDILKKITRKNINELTPAEKGTIMHKLVKIINDTDIEKEFNRLIDSNIFKKEELDQINKDKIIMYLNSDTYKRIDSSQFVKREMPFMMKKKACEIYKDIDDNNDDEVIIQGIIDCLFEEDGEIVILDYKTDKVIKDNITKEERIEEIKKHYKMQLDLYEEAVKLIYDKPIKEKILYLFDTGDTVKLD